MLKFKHIHFKEKQIPEKSLKGYRVYSDKTNFQNVEAATAAEAIEKSGMKNPVKVEVIGVVNRSIFSDTELAELSPPPAAVAPETPATQPPQT